MHFVLQIVFADCILSDIRKIEKRVSCLDILSVHFVSLLASCLHAKFIRPCRCIRMSSRPVDIS